VSAAALLTQRQAQHDLARARLSNTLAVQFPQKHLARGWSEWGFKGSAGEQMILQRLKVVSLAVEETAHPSTIQPRAAVAI
jgi:hypothetical protein